MTRPTYYQRWQAGTDEQRAKQATERSLDGKCLLALEATDAGTCAARILDQRDADIVRTYLYAFNAQDGPREGDYVRFADGIERRVSHVWANDPSDPNWKAGVQTSDGGSWHLGRYGCSFSGALYPLVPFDTLAQTDELKDGSAWIFHHDHKCADNGVDFVAPFRVYTCSSEAPR